ncbi:unnamed protein product [Dicrocoelium dendriticum]|nr:unnamed protein product [Dicrocoelium dendriticum]
MGNQIHLRITNLKLDSKFSWLRVLDGDNCGARELKLVDTTVEFSPFNCTSTSTTMTVVFASAWGSENAEVAASFIDTYTLMYRS